MSDDGYRYQFPTDHGEIEVLRIGSEEARRKVVLLHELGGLAPATIEFAEFLRDDGQCVVHMPVIFGRLGQDNAALGLAQACWSRQLTMLLGNRRSPSVSWLLDFCSHTRGSSADGVTVIGMCATGGLVFSVLAHPDVAAGVAAQPSLPYRPRWVQQTARTLGASEQDVQAAAASGKPFAALGYRSDHLCPAGRLNKIEELFPGDVTRVDGKGHSTLVYEPAEVARSAVLQLLEETYM